MNDAALSPTGPGTSVYLLLAGAASLGVGLLHVGIIFYGGPAYRYFGAGERLARLAERGSQEPAFVTSVLILMFAGWAAYAFSGAGLVRRLPYLPTALLLIGLIYTGRGLALVPQLYLWMSGGFEAVPVRHLWFSAASLAIGILYLAGTLLAAPVPVEPEVPPESEKA